MHYGFRIVEHLISGMEGWMREKGYRTIDDFVGRSVPRIKSWGDLDLNYKIVARIDQEKCIHCGLCYIACEDGCHQSIRWDRVAGRLPVGERIAQRRDPIGRRTTSCRVPGGGVINVFTIKEDICVGCNMCSLVCPVEGCITMPEVDTGRPPMTWNEYQAKLAAARSRRSDRRSMSEVIHGVSAGLPRAEATDRSMAKRFASSSALGLGSTSAADSLWTAVSKPAS